MLLQQISLTQSVKPMRAMYSVRVLATRMLTPTIRSIQVDKPADFVFRSSQAARVFLPTPQGIEPHPLSIASSPTRDYLEFAVRRSESVWKQSFFELNEGDTINIEGPVARFFLDTTRPGILIAGGIGITPFKGMIEYVADMHLPIQLTLLYSNRTKDEIAYQPELDALSENNPNIRIHYTLTRTPINSDWIGRVGRIDIDWLRQVSADQPDAVYYLCGTPHMLAEVTQWLESLGISAECIMHESFRGYARHT